MLNSDFLGGELAGDIAMVIQNISKSFHSVMVVNDFNLQVKQGECIAILGGGSSGKSTLCQVITGAVLPTDGQCYIKGFSLTKKRNHYLAQLGYCSQTDTMFDNFTGTQMLDLMGKLKGIPLSQLDTHVKQWLQVFGKKRTTNFKIPVF